MDEEYMKHYEAWPMKNRPDEEQLITLEWWDAVFGGRQVDIDGGFMLYLTTRIVVELCAETAALNSDVFTLPLRHIKTRGDVRKLCAAIGIELKEQA